MIIDNALANKLLAQWGRWSSQPINKSEINRDTGQPSDNPLAIKKPGTAKADFNEPLMILIDGILRSDRLTQKQKEITKLQWQVRPYWDQEQRKQCYNRRHPRCTITIDQYKKLVRSIKSIVADGVQKNTAILIRDTIAMKKHSEKYIDRNA